MKTQDPELAALAAMTAEQKAALRATWEEDDRKAAEAERQARLDAAQEANARFKGEVEALDASLIAAGDAYRAALESRIAAERAAKIAGTPAPAALDPQKIMVALARAIEGRAPGLAE